MRRPRVLVVYKQSVYERLRARGGPRLRRLLGGRLADVLDMRRGHAVHRRTLEAVVRALRREPVELTVAHRVGLRVRRRYDLAVSVGGDGTFLVAAHSVGDAPILGVNSDPARSEAVFCAANRRTFRRLLRQALARRLRELAVHPLQLRLNGRRLPHRIINDVLVVHENPATMSRYRLRIGSRAELQKSSGLWIATAAGSSSAVLAAGGVKLPWSARRFQYRPRELYRGRLSRYRLTGGVLPAGARVRVTWLMRRGRAYLDGPHLSLPLQFGDEMMVRLARARPVQILGLPAR